jgi:hypothetical protein
MATIASTSEKPRWRMLSSLSEGRPAVVRSDGLHGGPPDKLT